MWLVSIIGLANIFLRFIIGLISLHPAIVAAKFTALSLMFSGSSSIVTAFFPQHPFLYQAIYCACFALGNGRYFSFPLFPVLSMRRDENGKRFMTLNLPKHMRVNLLHFFLLVLQRLSWLFVRSFMSRR